MDDSTEFYIQFETNRSIPISVGFNGHMKRPRNLSTVAHLINAYVAAVSPRFDLVPIDNIQLCLPSELTRSTSGLSEECFTANGDDENTELRSGLPLEQLNGLGFDDRRALIARLIGKIIFYKSTVTKYSFHFT